MEEQTEFKRTLRGLENPFPFFAEATHAASRLYQSQRDYLMVTAELRARREAKRAAFLAGSLILGNIALTLALFWVTNGLHEAGWSSWTVAIVSFLVFGAFSGLCAYLGIEAGKTPERRKSRPATPSGPSPMTQAG